MKCEIAERLSGFLKLRMKAARQADTAASSIYRIAFSPVIR
jgi:hypothetical protein